MPTVFLAGITMVIAGVAEVINAFQSRPGQLSALPLVGALYIVAGFFAFERRAQAEAPRPKNLEGVPLWANFSDNRRKIETSICGARLTR